MFHSFRAFFGTGLSYVLFVTVQPVFSSHFTWAQYNHNFQRGRYPAKWGGDSIVYRYLIPYHYKSSSKYPLVVTLHGLGERGTDNDLQAITILFCNVLGRQHFAGGLSLLCNCAAMPGSRHG